MNFEEYQRLAHKTADYEVPTLNGLPLTWDYPVHGLAGEAGEVSEQFKRVIREDKGILTPLRLEKIKNEIGDALWYISEIATTLHLSLDRIATANIEKLSKRVEQGTIHGEGSAR